MRAGERLGEYELIAPIGAGGMGEVWRALDPALGRHVAIKILSPEYSRDPDRLRRFEQEARAPGCSIIRTCWRSTPSANAAIRHTS
jgi:eukaryotic-like serine/threonine-protein kinase